MLARVHALLAGMLRGYPDLILDSCSVCAKRGGDLTGPNPTDRAKRGTKYHVSVRLQSWFSRIPRAAGGRSGAE